MKDSERDSERDPERARERQMVFTCMPSSICTHTHTHRAREGDMCIYMLILSMKLSRLMYTHIYILIERTPPPLGGFFVE